MKYTTESFIAVAKKKRTDKDWGYDKVIYVSSHTKICVTCPIHGDFWITPTNFLSGKGCKKCALENRKRKDNEQIINEFKKIHGDLYDYSKVAYKDAKEKVCVICHKHGEFLISPDKHLHGQGCQKCSKEKYNNSNYFLEKLFIVYGDKYDYSKTRYINNRTKVCVICPIHGEFWQMPNTHLNGKGCPICAKEKKLKEKKRLKKALKEEKQKEKEKEIISKCIIKHENKYSYEKCHFVDYNTKFTVTCHEHGDFLVTPGNHLQGKGCPKCAGKGKTDEDAINDFKKVHGEEYIYNKMHYVNATTKVCIICRKHGEFWLTPNKHLNGRGCPICNESLLEKHVRDYFNENNIKFIARATKKYFSWLELQHLDFYLPDYGVAIECQGEQHLRKGKYYFVYKNVEKQFIKQLNLDIVKHKKCNENNLKLFYILPKSFENKDIENEPIFEGIYSKKNTFYSIKELKEQILDKIAREMQLI